jgi:steroid delta-isomerase-like uncharacterized protein
MPHTDTASIERNRTLGRQFFEEQDRSRGGPPENILAGGYVCVLGGNPPMDRAGHNGFARGFYAAFPDLRHIIEDVFATEDRVTVRFFLQGTQTGDFFGIPATHKPINVAAHAIFHVTGGKITKTLGVFDEAGMLRQLGVLPT